MNAFLAWSGSTVKVPRLLKNDPAFNADYFQLLDLTSVAEIRMDVKTVMELAEIILFSANSRRAFIADDTFHYAVARLFAAFHKHCGEDHIRVFSTADEASQWLEVDLREAA